MNFSSIITKKIFFNLKWKKNSCCGNYLQKYGSYNGPWPTLADFPTSTIFDVKWKNTSVYTENFSCNNWLEKLDVNRKKCLLLYTIFFHVWRPKVWMLEILVLAKLNLSVSTEHGGHFFKLTDQTYNEFICSRSLISF